MQFLTTGFVRFLSAHVSFIYFNRTENFMMPERPKNCRACKKYLKDYVGKKHLRHPFGYQVSDVWDDIHRVRHNPKRIDAHPCQ